MKFPNSVRVQFEQRLTERQYQMVTVAAAPAGPRLTSGESHVRGIRRVHWWPAGPASEDPVTSAGSNEAGTMASIGFLTDYDFP